MSKIPLAAGRRSLLALGVLVAACGGERLADPDAIADRIAAQALVNYEGVQDFTIEGSGADGLPVVVYFRRAGADSLIAFEGRAFSGDSLRRPLPLPYALPNPTQVARGLRGNARLAGILERDGDRLYVLDVTDPAILIGNPGGAPSSLDSASVLVDTETFHVREVRLATPQSSLDPEAAAGAPPLVQRQLYEDFRTVGGFALPFQTTTLISGVVVDEETRLVQGGMIELRRRQAQALPPAERARVLEEVERQMAFLTAGEMENTFTVRDVRVNEGVPESLFE